MGFTAFPAATTAPDKEQQPAAAACLQLPFPRFVAAGNRLRLPPSPPAAALAAEASPATTTNIMAEEEPRPPPEKEGAGGDAALASSSAAVAAQDEEVEQRMDRLWEDFNDEPTQAQAARPRRRARSRGGSWRCDGMLAAEGPWSSPSEAGSEPAGLGGCGPVLRPSSRAAGGARHYRRRAGTWVLLMRIFRRLFVVEKTIAAPAAVARQRSSTRAR